MKEQISSDMSLKSIERIISEELKGKELWGDIDFSEEDYEALRDRIKQILSNNRYSTSDICRNFPKALTTFIVFMTRYKFDYNFWGLVATELNITITQTMEAEIGQCVRKTFDICGFDYSDVKDERRKYIEPILFEAGVPPESSLDDLFYILRYDSHAIFDPQLIVDDLINMRSYQIRKPMLRFFKRFQDSRALEFVLEVHDSMLSVDQNREGDSRYIEIYSEWKTQEKNKENTNSRKKQEFQTRPYISFEDGKRGLCMVLPHTLISNEWIDDVEWVVETSNGNTISKRMQVFGDEGRRYVQSIVVPINPAASYKISLIDNEDIDENVINEWEISGIAQGKALFFNSNGRIVTPNYLQFPYGIIIFSNQLNIIEKRNVDFNYQAYPTNIDGYTVATIEPLGKDAEFTFESDGAKKILKVRPQIVMDFEGHKLFGMDDDEESRLFTGIPELKIEIGEETNPGGLNIRIGKERIDIAKEFSDGIAKIILADFAEKYFKQYGTYSIRLYQYDHFLKQIEFSYIPDIKTSYRPYMKWPDKHEKERKTFEFECSDLWSIEFDNCTAISDDENYHVECPLGIGTLNGRVRVTDEGTDFECPFVLPVNPFFAQVVNSDGEIENSANERTIKLSLTDLDNTEYWIRLETFGDFSEYKFYVELLTANGIEQSEEIALSHSGSGNINLAVFYDTLRSRPLPAQLQLGCHELEEKRMPLAMISDSVELSRRPLYQESKDHTKGYITLSVDDTEKDLTVTKFGADTLEIHLSYEDSVLSKSGTSRGYLIQDGLEDGLYIVANSENNNFLFDDEGSVEITNGNNVVNVSHRGKNDPIVDFSGWLDQLIKDVLLAGMNRDIQGMPAWNAIQMVRTFEKGVSFVDCERLVALSCFATTTCVDKKKESIKNCMREVSEWILDRESRIDLLSVLSEIECSEDAFNLCLDEYELMMFKPGLDYAKDLAAKVINKSPELSLLLMMSADSSIRDTIVRDKYRDIIGKESIKSMLTVIGNAEPEKVLEAQRNFLREEKPCDVKVCLNTEISGDMKPIQNMIEVTYNSIYFNKSKKPDFGLYFDHIRYVDQYVNWYSLSHNRDGEMLPWKKKLMMELVKDYCRDIVNAINKIAGNVNDLQLRQMAQRYDEALKGRMQTDDIFSNLNSNNHGRYFYLQGIAAFLSRLPEGYPEYAKEIELGERFMNKAVRIANRIARRDIIMASTFIYLVRKEFALSCQ